MIWAHICLVLVLLLCFSPFGPFDIRTGGSSVTGKTYTASHQFGQWVAEADMPTARRNAFCARVVNSLGQEEVVVAGGYDGAARLNDVEIFNVVTNMWRTGKETRGEIRLWNCGIQQNLAICQISIKFYMCSGPSVDEGYQLNISRS